MTSRCGSVEAESAAAVSRGVCAGPEIVKRSSASETTRAVLMLEAVLAAAHSTAKSPASHAAFFPFSARTKNREWGRVRFPKTFEARNRFVEPFGKATG